MRANIGRSAAAAAGALILACTTLGGSTANAVTQTRLTPAAPAAASAPCSGQAKVEQKLQNGTTWRMCWRTDSLAGLVLEKVSYQPKRESAPIMVFDSAALAQVNVPYDSGSVEYDDLSDLGFGDEYALQDLTPAECPGGTIKSVWLGSQARAKKALCVTTQAHGYAYRSKDDDEYDDHGNVVRRGRVHQAQGKDLVLFTVSKVGWYEYVNQWIFSDDGTITGRVGATGDLSPGDYSNKGTGWPIGRGRSDYSTNHYHSVFWRLNFALDGSPKARVEQFATKRTGRSPSGVNILKTTRSPVTKELAGDSSLRRWWRVVSSTGKNQDGHPRSWELVQQHSDKYDPHAYTSHDVYFTQYRACEKFASHNQDPACRGRGSSVNTWVNGETLGRPTMWVNVGFHHIPRDEDQSPMPVHWQGFQLVPRDVTAMSPLTPDDRLSHNGHHEEGE